MIASMVRPERRVVFFRRYLTIPNITTESQICRTPMVEVAVVGTASRGHPPTQVLVCRRSRHHPASRIFLHCSAGFHASLPNVPRHRPFPCAL